MLELNESLIVANKVDHLYYEKMKDKATITPLCGLNKTIEKKSDDDKLPSFPKEIQATVDIVTQSCQTDQYVPDNLDELIS